MADYRQLAAQSTEQGPVTGVMFSPPQQKTMSIQDNRPAAASELCNNYSPDLEAEATGLSRNLQTQLHCSGFGNSLTRQILVAGLLPFTVKSQSPEQAVGDRQDCKAEAGSPWQ